MQVQKKATSQEAELARAEAHRAAKATAVAEVQVSEALEIQAQATTVHTQMYAIAPRDEEPQQDDFNLG